jgi:membrane protein DedA with SNARE-associated domain
MPYRSFLPWSVGGNLLWAAAFCGLGYGFYESADDVADLAQRVGVLVFVGLVAAGGLFGYLHRRRAT